VKESPDASDAASDIALGAGLISPRGQEPWR